MATSRIEQRLEVFGFSRTSTGGNCEAMETIPYQGIYVIVTDGEAGIPTDEDEDYYVGIFCEEHGDPLQEWNRVSPTELDAVLAVANEVAKMIAEEGESGLRPDLETMEVTVAKWESRDTAAWEIVKAAEARHDRESHAGREPNMGCWLCVSTEAAALEAEATEAARREGRCACQYCDCKNQRVASHIPWCVGCSVREDGSLPCQDKAMRS